MKTSEITDLLRKLAPLLHGQEAGLWNLLLTSGSAQREYKDRQLLRLLADRTAKADYHDKLLLPPPSPAVLSGEIKLGTVMYPLQPFAPLGLDPKELTRHMIVTGMTGSGKTNFVWNVINELSRLKVPFLVFDWKQSYRKLREQRGFENLQVIRVGEPGCPLRFNPLLAPPGTLAENWLALLVDVMRHAFFLGHGVEYLLRQAMVGLYRSWETHSFEIEFMPTLGKVEKIVRKEYAKGREMLWQSSAKRALAHLGEKGLLHETVNVAEPQSLPELLTEQVVIELDALPMVERIFMVEAILLWLYCYRKHQGEYQQLRHILILEEAHHILSAAKERESGGETIIEHLIRMVRSYGQGVIAVDQEPSKVSHSVLANAGCKVSFRLGNGWDVDAMAKSLGLSHDDYSQLLKLQTGHSIIGIKERFRENVRLSVSLAMGYVSESTKWRYHGSV